MSPITEVFKAKKFEWNELAHLAFQKIKQKLISAAILASLASLRYLKWM